MEKEINADQMRLQGLIESKTFAELSAEERNFVLLQMSERDYALKHLLIRESASISTKVEPRKLLVTQPARKGVVIPLYQAVAGIAAAILLTFLLVRGGEEGVIEVSDPVLAQIDTVYVDRTEYDTLVQYQTKYIQQPAPESTELVCCSPSSIESSDLNFLPVSNYDLKNRGSSASDDESLTRVVDFARIN